MHYTNGPRIATHREDGTVVVVAEAYDETRVEVQYHDLAWVELDAEDGDIVLQEDLGVAFPEFLGGTSSPSTCHLPGGGFAVAPHPSYQGGSYFSASYLLLDAYGSVTFKGEYALAGVPDEDGSEFGPVRAGVLYLDAGQLILGHPISLTNLVRYNSFSMAGSHLWAVDDITPSCEATSVLAGAKLAGDIGVFVGGASGCHGAGTKEALAVAIDGEGDVMWREVIDCSGLASFRAVLSVPGGAVTVGGVCQVGDKPLYCDMLLAGLSPDGIDWTRYATGMGLRHEWWSWSAMATLEDATVVALRVPGNLLVAFSPENGDVHQVCRLPIDGALNVDSLLVPFEDGTGDLLLLAHMDSGPADYPYHVPPTHILAVRMSFDTAFK